MNIEQKVKNLIDCNCDEAYKSRGLSAPDCPQCNYAEYVIELMKSYAKEHAVKFAEWFATVSHLDLRTSSTWENVYDEFIKQP